MVVLAMLAALAVLALMAVMGELAAAVPAAPGISAQPRAEDFNTWAKEKEPKDYYLLNTFFF